MQMQWKSISRRLLALSAALPLLFAGNQALAVTNAGTGTLNVTATVASYITVDFTNTGAVTGNSEGNSTNSYGATASLGFGTISAQGTNLATGVSFNASSAITGCTSGCFEVYAPVTVTVTAYNLKSSSFSMQAALGSTDSTNYWSVGSTDSANPALTTTGVGQTVSGNTTFNYNNALNFNVYLAVPKADSATAESSISNSIALTFVEN